MATTLQQAFSEAKPEDLVLIGLTGGIGSGKSAVASILRDLGETVLSADSLAKEAMLKKEVQGAINEVFEQELFPNGTIDTQAIAELVFGESEEHRENLETLNSIVHPFVIEALIEKLHQLHESGVQRVYNESALIYEAGFEEIYDYIVSVTAEQPLRISRLTEQRGLTKEEVKLRFTNQMSQEDKDKLADFTIANNGNIEQLQQAVENLHIVLSFLQPRRRDDDEME